MIFGASGSLAQAIAHALLAIGRQEAQQWQVDLVTREATQAQLAQDFAPAIRQGQARVFAASAPGYSSFLPPDPARAYFFTQALFDPKPFTAMDPSDIARELEVGLVNIIELTHQLLSHHPPDPDDRRDYCFIGSTSAYSGFRNTAVYCAVKHGLLGFVRAMNDEYQHTETRFWLFSMGTMNTPMGRLLTEQDPSTFLDPSDVAARIVQAISSPSNLFEPEVILRRRAIRALKPSAPL